MVGSPVQLRSGQSENGGNRLLRFRIVGVFECATATAPLAGCTAVAMIGHPDRAPCQVSLEQIGQINRADLLAAEFKLQHLVEVAIEDLALPADGDQRSAHYAIQIGGLVGVLEQLHVVVKLVARHQLAAEALDRHVGQGEQLIEDDAVAGSQLFLVRLRQRWLVGSADSGRAGCKPN